MGSGWEQIRNIIIGIVVICVLPYVVGFFMTHSSPEYQQREWQEFWEEYYDRLPKSKT